MLIVLTVAALAIIGLGGWVLEESSYDGEWAGAACITLGIIGLVVCIIAMFCVGAGIKKLDVIDAKIEMYTEENIKIETQIADTVQKYMEYETGIFTEVSPDSAMTLVALYPELKADALVSRQIDVYVENNNIIKELKADKINGSVLRWWLYFGK